MLEISCGRDDFQAAMSPKVGAEVDLLKRDNQTVFDQAKKLSSPRPDRLSTPTAVYECYLWRSQQPVSVYASLLYTITCKTWRIYPTYNI